MVKHTDSGLNMYGRIIPVAILHQRGELVETHYNMQNCSPLTAVGVYFQVFSGDAHKKTSVYQNLGTK